MFMKPAPMGGFFVNYHEKIIEISQISSFYSLEILFIFMTEIIEITGSIFVVIHYVSSALYLAL